VGGKVVPPPWHGRFWDHDERGSRRLPLDGEVAWILSEGPNPHWRGHIIQLVYELARD
jgi:hypothetical protein